MKTLLCFGDSNTHGTLPMPDGEAQDRLPLAERWPSVTAAALGAGWEVIAEGHPGRTTVHDDPIEGAHRNGLTVLPSLLASHRPLDVVAIMLGTNDCKLRFSVGAADIAAGVERLARLTLAAGCGPDKGAPRLVIVAPVPLEEAGCLAGFFEGGAAKSRALAPLLRQVASRLGAGFVDAGTLARVDPLDGVHLQAGDHAAIGAAVAEVVKEVATC